MPRIYVACLASYNNGVLHGEWIDVNDTDDADSLMEQINAMLRGSQYPNVEVDCPECGGDGHACPGTCLEGEPCCHVCEECNGTGKVPSSEEWAVHDYDEIPSSFGEYPDLDKICEYVQMIEKHGEAWVAYLDYCDPGDASESDFEQRFQGAWDSPADYAEHWIDETTDLSGVPDIVKYHIDYEGIARDFQLGGDVSYVEHDAKTYVFDNH